MSGKKKSPLQDVDEQMQAPLRKRLRLIRQLRGFNIHQVQVISSGTITKYETHDISSMSIGSMFALAKRLDISIEQFVRYLFEIDDIDERDTIDSVRRMTLLFRQLEEDEQNLALDFIRSLVDYNNNKKQTHSTRVMRSSRKVIQEHIANADIH